MSHLVKNHIIHIVYYVWIYENGANDFLPHHPFVTLISLNVLAASKSCKRAKIAERTGPLIDKIIPRKKWIGYDKTS